MACSALSSMCCAAQCAGSLCCSLASCFGCSSRSPALAKLVYLVIFLCSATLAVFMRFLGQPALSSWVPALNVCNGSIPSCFGVQAVYRISFALAAFFLIMAALVALAPVTHRGGWLIKFTLYIVLLGLTLLIPNSNMIQYAEAARVFSVIFLFTQGAFYFAPSQAPSALLSRTRARTSPPLANSLSLYISLFLCKLSLSLSLQCS